MAYSTLQKIDMEFIFLYLQYRTLYLCTRNYIQYSKNPLDFFRFKSRFAVKKKKKKIIRVEGTWLADKGLVEDYTPLVIIFKTTYIFSLINKTIQNLYIKTLI